MYGLQARIRNVKKNYTSQYGGICRLFCHFSVSLFAPTPLGCRSVSCGFPAYFYFFANGISLLSITHLTGGGFVFICLNLVEPSPVLAGRK